MNRALEPGFARKRVVVMVIDITGLWRCMVANPISAARELAR